MSVNDISKFKTLFIEEATTLLNSMESIILQLEENPKNMDLIQEVFRVMHTIKGVSGMYGYTAMSELTHNAENIYDLIRNDSIELTQEILDQTLIIVDQLFALIKDEHFEKKENQQKQTELHNWCNQIIINNKNRTKKVQLKKLVREDSLVTYNVIFHTHQSIIDRRINVFYTIKDLAEIGEIKSINALPVDGEDEERWSIFVVGNFTQLDIEDALMFVFEYCIIRKVADFDVFNTEEMAKIQKELLLEEETHLSTTNNEKSDSNNKPKVKTETKLNNTESMIASIRQNMNRISVDSEKLDYLMYLVSEFITTSSQLNLSSKEKGFESIRPQIEKLDRLSKQFRNNALEIRLIPIRDMVPKFNRLVRDISNSLGKEIEFATEGMETELDKSSIDLVAEPLVHMLRNALDHGIELPEDRIAAGKDAKGTIKLKAYNSGNNIFIEISDDGKGLNRESIIKKAISKGLINKGDNLSDKDIYKLICEPGFSTASEVTAISGRGVGMDVVKQKIAEMRGELEITSIIGKGTTFTIKLQQSIAILDTLLVRSGKMKFLLPLSDVEICAQMHYENVEKRLKHATVDFEEELIPFVSLRNLFDINGDQNKMAKMIMIKKNNNKFAIFADEILGQHQAVLKPMGELVKSHEEISAASVLGNGEVAFLLDTNSINQNLYSKAI
ncbi:chemotaxis protein CheA [Plebeiibacterium sediminum]|uniref:Chemotaxis protein CheA n=1 Tax=Plebeiibacterium sediminum TaxID=2992112 RepID=A0AAE3M1E3_9BACT|nr:chemotaxis protein CheA [Plebeiobacterium sediminum]MCW3785067.1 chemotaxis protein CheA [Plebeiobacterium sediminum]